MYVRVHVSSRGAALAEDSLFQAWFNPGSAWESGYANNSQQAQKLV